MRSLNNATIKRKYDLKEAKKWSVYNVYVPTLSRTHLTESVCGLLRT